MNDMWRRTTFPSWTSSDAEMDGALLVMSADKLVQLADYLGRDAINSPILDSRR